MTSDSARRARFDAIACEVFEPLQRYLRRRAPVADAEEAFADSLLVIWRRLDDVPPDRPLPWSYGVARRCLANVRRTTDRHLRLVERVGAQPPGSAAGDPQNAIEAADPELAAAIATLTASEAEIVRLWAWEQLAPSEIALVLDLTPNAVSVGLNRAKRKLRDHIDRQNQPPSGHTQAEGATEPGRNQR